MNTASLLLSLHQHENPQSKLQLISGGAHVQVECQPYHLEAAGCWNKLKNCLVDIDMFGIWWTPAHKKEFVALWASLANANNQVRFP